MKLATSKPVLLLTVHSAGWPAQLLVMLLLKLKLPTMVSAFRISRDRSVRLPPAFSVCLPLIQVTLSKIWKSFWFVMSGWLLLAPRFRMFWNASCVIAEVDLVEVDARDADGLGRVGAVVDRRHQELDLTTSRSGTRSASCCRSVCVSLNARLCALMLPSPAPKVAPASPCGSVAG